MANDETDTTSAQDGADGGVHRLRDILVEEVSLVDRAANKRRFLIVKRSDMAKSAAPDKGEKKPPGAKKPKAKAPAKATANRSKAKARGRSPGTYGASTRKAAKAAEDEYDDDDDDETEKAAGGEDQGEDEDNEDEAEKADEYDDEDEAEKADDEDSDDGDEAEKADDAEENDDDDETEKAAKVDDEDDEESEKAAKADDEEYDDQPSGKRPAPKKKTTAKADGDGDGDGDGDDDDDDDDSDDDDSVVLPADLKTTVLRALTQGIERLVAVANRIKDADAPDDDGAAYVPEDVTEELDDIGELLEGIGDRLPTTKAIAKGGARMAKDRLNRFQKALELLSQVLKELTEARQPAVQPGGAGKRTTKRDATPGVAELVTQVADLLAVVKQQQAQLDRIHKAHGTSNALVVEGSSRDRRAPAEVSWPFDMNRPISRDSVAKATSFYDDAD